MKKIFTAIILFALAFTASAQTFSADQLEKYAKDKYGDNWTKAADNLHQGWLSTTRTDSTTRK